MNDNILRGERVGHRTSRTVQTQKRFQTASFQAHLTAPSSVNSLPTLAGRCTAFVRLSFYVQLLPVFL